MITRRQLLGSAPAFLAAPKRPNILYVMTDDHVPRAMSCYGSKVLRTPNFDRLAEEGCRFENAFCTNSLCAPARASVLTGTYSHINGVIGNSEGADAIEHIDGKLAMYPQVLKANGYRTAVVGKWHIQDPPQGFDYSCILPGQGLYFDPVFIENGQKKTFKGYATDITTDLALAWLQQQSAAQPWCLVFQHKSPHRPFLPAPRHAKLLANTDVPHPETYDDDYATRKLAREAEDMKFDISLEPDYKDMPKGMNARQKKDWIYQRFVKDYYCSAYGVDENLGRVLEHLDKTGQAANTVVVYSSDNGFFLGDHGWYDKRFMYEPSLRIPLLIRYPDGARTGAVVRDMALNIDYAPTILDLAGVKVPASMQGRSLRPILEGRTPKDWRRSMYYTYYEDSWRLRGKAKEAMTDPSFQFFTPHRVSPHRGVRTERYKLIEYYRENGYWELFDLVKDPNELRNVAEDPAYANIRRDLAKELGRLRAQFRDPGRA